MEILKPFKSILRIAGQSKKKICLDTNIFIYYLEGNPDFDLQTNALIDDIEAMNLTVVASRIVEMEFLVGPIKKQLNGAEETFYEFCKDFGVHFVDVNQVVAQTAAKIRAEYGFKQMDSLHIATAVSESCDWFVTNDSPLIRCNELKVIDIADYEAGKLLL